MADDPVTLSCFNASTEAGQLYYIYSAIVGEGGVGEDVHVTNLFALDATVVASNALLTTLSTNLAKIPVTQGSTTSGQSGELVQGAVTTAAPTYTTGQTSPLSLTTGGSLRVTTTATGVQDPIARTALTGNATIAAGFKCITVFTSTDWVGTVAGVTFPANATETYPAPTGNTLGSLAIVRTAGTLYYSTIG